MPLGVLETALLTLTFGVVTPLVALATVIVTPLSDRRTQGLVTMQYFALIGTVAAL